MRLLWWVHTKLPPARLETLLKVAEPTGGGEAVTEAYDALKEKMTEARTEGSASPTPPTEETAAPAF